MNLIDYILSASGEEDNLIVANIRTGIGMHRQLAKWSESNRDYILAVPTLALKEQMKMDYCEFEFIVTNHYMGRIANGNVELNDERFIELYNKSKIILLENTALSTLRRTSFKLNLSTSNITSFERSNYNPVNKTFHVEKTDKKVFNFGVHNELWWTMKLRNNKLDKLFEGEER